MGYSVLWFVTSGSETLEVGEVKGISFLEACRHDYRKLLVGEIGVATTTCKPDVNVCAEIA
jgi:hypothetical protein